MFGISIVSIVQSLVFCLGIYVIVRVIRRLERIPKLEASHFWNEVALPILPPLLGALVAWIAKLYPYPEGISSTSSRVIFGLVCGFFSGLIYRIAWAFIRKKLADNGIDVSEFESMRPVAKLHSIMPGASPPLPPPTPPAKPPESPN